MYWLFGVLQISPIIFFFIVALNGDVDLHNIYNNLFIEMQVYIGVHREAYPSDCRNPTSSCSWTAATFLWMCVPLQIGMHVVVVKIGRYH